MKVTCYLIIILLTSCTTIIECPEIRGYIYDSKSKTPIENVKVKINTKTIYSDKNGFFIAEISKIEKLFNFEGGYEPITYSIELEHPNYSIFKIENSTRGSFSNKLIVYDSIFLKPK